MRASSFVLPLLAIGMNATATPVADGLASPARLIVTQVPAAPGDPDPDALPDGSRLVLLDPARPQDAPRVLSQGFAAAGRASMADDGVRFLFVARRRRGEPLQAWEGDLRGGPARRVTKGAEDCFDAFYLPQLYTIDAAAPEPRLGLRCETGDGTAAIFTCRADGSDARRVTFTPDGVSGPLPLGDGRIAFVPRGRAIEPILVVNIDGTDVQAFASVGDGGAWSGAPCETPHGRVAFVEAGRSVIAVPVERSLLSREELYRDPDARIRAPAPLDDTSLVLGRRAPEPGATWDLVRVDLPGRRVEPMLATEDWDEVAATPVVPHGPRPGRSSVVDARETGLLYCLDALRTGLAPARRGGEAASGRLEILTAVRPGGPASGPASSRLLDTVAIETDGSFYLRIPARTPLRFRLVDAAGRPVSEMTSWIWVMPSEARGCIGCHEDRSLTPPNRHVLALRNVPHEVEP